jgi:hypothetical protein
MTSDLGDDDENDDELSSDPEEAKRSLQIFDTLVSKDPSVLSKEISKLVVLGSFHGSSTSLLQEEKVSEKAETPQDEGMKQLLLVAQESKAYGIDRSVFVGDNLWAVDGKADGRIQFTGRVGTESRSLRTLKPLAKPQALTKKQVREMRQKGHGNLLRRRHKTVFQPFVVPFLNKQGDLSFIPRLVSYYEIQITHSQGHPAFGTSGDETKEEHDPEKCIWDTECIAIGLASSEFPLKDTMPGWKPDSLAYHSDDGSAWASRQRRCAYAPKFGVGDVVGCGIDYRIGTVFYTLNGNFLGHASVISDAALQSVDWYPTIGLDSHDFVQCNFGFAEPFSFDLFRYCQEEPPTAYYNAMSATSTRSKKTYLRLLALQKILSSLQPKPTRRQFLSNGEVGHSAREEPADVVMPTKSRRVRQTSCNSTATRISHTGDMTTDVLFNEQSDAL